MQKNEREVLCIFGLAGSGKTRYARRYLSDWSRAVVIEGGFADEKEYDGLRFDDYWSLHHYMEKNADGLFRVRYTCRREEFPLVCDIVRAAGGCCFLIDEADRYLIQGQLDPEWQDLVIRGRHYGNAGEGVSIVIISSDPMKMPIDLRRQATRMIIFNTTEPSDVKWLEDVVGKEWAEKCKSLQKGEFIEWTKGVGCRASSLKEIKA